MKHKSIKQVLLLQFYNVFNYEEFIDLNYSFNDYFYQEVYFEYKDKKRAEHHVMMSVEGYIEKRQLQHKYCDDTVFDNWYIRKVEVYIDSEKIDLISIDDINTYYDEREKEKIQ